MPAIRAAGHGCMASAFGGTRRKHSRLPGWAGPRAPLHRASMAQAASGLGKATLWQFRGTSDGAGDSYRYSAGRKSPPTPRQTSSPGTQTYYIPLNELLIDADPSIALNRLRVTFRLGPGMRKSSGKGWGASSRVAATARAVGREGSRRGPAGHFLSLAMKPGSVPARSRFRCSASSAP